MVKVSKIDYSTFIELGFESRTQAANAYKGIRSKSGETADEYLRRTWVFVKHVVYANKLKQLVQDEEILRKGICSEWNTCYTSVKKQEKQERVYSNRMEEKYERVKEERNEMIKTYNKMCTRVQEAEYENRRLTNGYNSLLERTVVAERSVIELHTEKIALAIENRELTRAYQTSCCAAIRHNKIMELPTKKTSQCHACPICNDVVTKKETVYDTCHVFHIRCLTFWLLNNTTCPCCRSNVL